MNGYSTVCKIDLDNVIFNYEAVKEYVAPSQVIPVLKGNAYGHGAVALARALVGVGCRRIAVAKLCEALELRRAGIQPGTVDIIIMSGMLPHEIDRAIEIGASFFVQDARTLNYVKSIECAQRPPRIHIKVDTGMGRFGFMPEEGQAVGEVLRSLKKCKIEGVGTHLSAGAEEEYSQRQLERFDAFLAQVKLPDDALIHVASSSAVLHFPWMFRSAVRVGDLIYGFSSVGDSPLRQRPALSYVSTVTQVKRLPPGWHVGYGVDRLIQAPTTTATVAMGTIDGLMSSQVGRSHILIHGTRCTLLAVCADAAIVDVSSVSSVQHGDPAVYIGCQNGAVIGVSEQASAARTGFSELLAKISSRTPRLYYRDGKCVGEMSSLKTVGCASTHAGSE